ncbi:hypothetical protein C0J52_10124 [Blattella germanica]|nr:hypothetical protein C0J52_10124 [Blattella germanica]
MGQSNSLQSSSEASSSEISNGSLPEPFDHYIPEEVLIHILSYVSAKSLIKLRLVCRLWKQLIDKEVWRLKVARRDYTSLNSVSPKQKLPWYVYYWICLKDPFEKNLLRNHCGQVRSNGGSKWTIENPPAGADELPRTEEFGDITSCFATSFHSCSKEQVIRLKYRGFNHLMMDEVRPDIEVSEWYAGRFDCGSIYEMEVELLNETKDEVLETFSFRKTIKQWEGREWIKNYKPGVRYIRFYHGGVDTQYWLGHYGSKMSGACVKLVIPSTLTVTNTNEEEESLTDDV